jgi:hypothetical protein
MTAWGQLEPNTLASANDGSGSTAAAWPRRDERPEWSRKPGVRGGQGELPGGVEPRPIVGTRLAGIGCQRGVQAGQVKLSGEVDCRHRPQHL